MKTFFFVILSCSAQIAIGNVNFIQYEEIPNAEMYLEWYEFVRDNQVYYDHWQPEWTYDISKAALIQGLKESFEVFTNADSSNVEVNLLLGDICHYLYNLEEQDYFDAAVKHFNRAIELAPNDFRPYWFLGNHYALSNVQDESVKYFLKGKELLPPEEPSAFWEEFSFATAIANMPSHCVMAMDKAKLILGAPSYFEEQLGNSIYQRIVPVNTDSTYSFQDIWTMSEADLLAFTSRPLGVKLLIDSTWHLQLYDYQDYQSFLTIVPPVMHNEAGQEITITIAMIMKVAQPGDNLDDFIHKFTARFLNKEKFEFSKKYSNLISYKFSDENMYQEFGGAHIHMIGLKRDRPEYAGLVLEQPVMLPETNSDKMVYYRAAETRDRFEGTIFYGLMLDACEDVYEEAYELFKQIFEDRIIIE